MKPEKEKPPVKRERVYNGFFKVEKVTTPVGVREVVIETDAVNALLHDEQNRRVLLVRQARPGMITEQNPEGLITETVSGRFDANLKVNELVVKEALEEAGVYLSDADVHILNAGKPMAISPGQTVGKVYLAYAVIRSGSYEIKERKFGLPEEGEVIERVWIPVDDLQHYIVEDSRVFALIQWFLRTHYTHHNPVIAALQKVLRQFEI